VVAMIQNEIQITDWRGNVSLVCGFCGTTFERARSLVLRERGVSKTHFCSTQCRNKGLKGFKHSEVFREQARARALKNAKRGTLNPNWKGGRYIDKDGYVHIHVPNHPCAYSNGWALEHIVFMCGLLGRRLMRDEEVHHKDKNKSNNDLTNLELLTKTQHARKHHFNPQNRGEDEINIQIICACGCGQRLKKYDERGRPRTVLHGHNNRRSA
jgi:hypothetical protein